MIEDSYSDDESYMGHQDMDMLSTEQGGHRMATKNKTGRNMVYSSNTESDLDDEL